MFGENSSAKWLWLLALLFVANLGYYFYNNWGLVTVKVRDEPLREVISSIEWQGWVKIYTNLPLDSKVTMYADHVPLAEAMEILAVNVDVPPPPADGDDTTRPRRQLGPDGQPVAGTPPGAQASNTPPAQPGASAPNPAGPGGGPGQGGPPGGRGGGFRTAQWNLAFFVAPTEVEAKQEIREFQSSDPNDDNKVYSYSTQMQLVSTDTTTTAPDPWQQSWPGVKPVDPSATPAPANPPATNATADSSSTNAAPAQPGTDQPDPNAPPTVHTYLQDLASSANVWIMAPGSWAPQVANPPPANSSIVSAIKNLVRGSHGVVMQAIVLRAGRGGAPGGNRGNFTDDGWADRMRNAINGLPPDERPDALDQLNKEVDFRKSLQALPQDQRRQAIFQHTLEKMLYGERLSRMSPEKRAQAYQRMVTARAAARGQ